MIHEICGNCGAEAAGLSPGFDQGSIDWCPKCGSIDNGGEWLKPEAFSAGAAAERAAIVKYLKGGNTDHYAAAIEYGQHHRKDGKE